MWTGWRRPKRNRARRRMIHSSLERVKLPIRNTNKLKRAIEEPSSGQAENLSRFFMPCLSYPGACPHRMGEKTDRQGA